MAVAKIMLQRNLMTVLSYGFLQVTTAAISIFRIPLTIHEIGTVNYGLLAIVIGMWPLLAIPGEAHRKSAQIGALKNSIVIIEKSKLPLDTLFVLILCISVYFFLTLNEQIDARTLGVVLAIFAITGFLNCFNGYIRGSLERLNLTKQSNILTSIGFLASFPFFIVSIKIGTILAITIGYAFFYILPMIFQLTYCIIKKIQFKLCEEKPSKSIGKKFIWYRLILSEMLAYSLDIFIVALLLGPASAAEFSIYQKISTIGTATNTALAPIQVITRDKLERRKLFNFGLCLTILSILLLSIFLPKLVNLLSHGSFESNSWVMAAIAFNCITGSLTSGYIQRNNEGERLEMRVNATLISSLLGLGFTALLIKSFGLGIAFWSSAGSLIFIFIALLRLEKSNENSI